MANKSKLKVIPLGGLNEIGKNLTVFEYEEDILILDCGMAFPDDDMLGIDLVIPDIAYLLKNQEKIRGIVLTHGHEDHIGALPYVLRDINVPVYGTRLTLGLVENKLKEHNLIGKVALNCVKAGDSIKLGQFKVEFIHTNHSIADAVSIAIYTPVGTVLHTGDFKIDSTPIDGEMIDLARIGEIGKKGVLLLMSDSTNAERPGYTMSERTVGATFNNLFRGSDQRILVATFASNVHRVQQIINAAYQCGRKVAVSGRSMENVVEVAINLGYMNVPEGVLISLDDIKRYKNNELVIVTTGSQGESMSALARMAHADHKKVEITRGDLVIISASPIPGNEKVISNVINDLLQIGADVIYEALENIHVSGHACQEELKLILGLAKPKYFMPVHGEYKHLKKHANLAKVMNVKPQNIFINSVGQVLELDKTSAKVTGIVPSGYVLVDGLGVGDVGNIVLRDRKHLSQDGLIVIVVTIDKESREVLSGPDIISRGFVYVREAEDLMDSIKNVALKSIEKTSQKNTTDWISIKGDMKNSLSEYLYEKTKRRPMILPVITEV